MPIPEQAGESDQEEETEQTEEHMELEDRSWFPNPGEPAIASSVFQLLYGLYLGALTALFMKSADAAGGGLHGFSLGLMFFAIIVGFGSSWCLSRRLNSVWQRVLLGAPLAGLTFLLVISLGLILPFELEYGQGTWQPPVYGVLMYFVAAIAIFAGLSPRITPEASDEGEYSTERFQAHFDNKFKMFQAYLSVAIAAVVGAFLPVSTIMVKRQNLILGPLVWFAVGLFISFVVLVAQLQVSKYYVEKAYDQHVD